MDSWNVLTILNVVFLLFDSPNLFSETLVRWEYKEKLSQKVTDCFPPCSHRNILNFLDLFHDVVKSNKFRAKPPVLHWNVILLFFLNNIWVAENLSLTKECAPFYDVAIPKKQGTPLPSPRHNVTLAEEKKLTRSWKREQQREKLCFLFSKQTLETKSLWKKQQQHKKLNTALFSRMMMQLHQFKGPVFWLCLWRLHRNVEESMCGTYVDIEADGFLRSRQAEGFPTGLVIGNKGRRHWQLLFAVHDHLAFLGGNKKHTDTKGSSQCNWELVTVDVTNSNSFVPY